MAKPQRRDSILRAARSVFAEKGYHQASVADILAAADIARGTFYLYFDSKRAIFDELIEVFLVALRMGIRDIVPDADHPSPIDQLRDNLRRSLALFLEERELSVILLNQAVGLDREFDRRLTHFYDRVVAIIERALHKGVDMGMVRKCDSHLVASFVLGGLKETAFRLVVRKNDRPKLDEIVDELMNTALAGILESGAVRRELRA